MRKRNTQKVKRKKEATLRVRKNGLKFPNQADIKQTISSLFKRMGRLTNASGWIGGPDSGVATEPELSEGKVSMVADTLVVQSADMYLAEIRQKIAALELDRRYFLDLQDRYTRQVLEHYEFDQQLAIHLEEVKRGWYTVDHAISEEELNAASAWRSATADQKSEMDKLITGQLLSDLKTIEIIAKTKAAVEAASHVSAYRKVHADSAQTDNLATSEGTVISYNIESERVPEFKKETPPGTIGPSYENLVSFVYRMARNDARAAASLYASNAVTQSILSRGTADVAQHQTAAKQLKEDWARSDIEFRKLRTELAIRLEAMREDAASEKGGALNYGDELVRLKADFMRRLRDVVARSIVAVNGLRQLWGAKEISDPPLPWQWNDAKGSYVQGIKTWLLDTEAYLGRLQRAECSTAIPISVRTTIGEKRWKDAIGVVDDPKVGGLMLQFFLSQDKFVGLTGIRIRGVSIFSLGISDEQAGTWTGWIRPPRATLVHDPKRRSLIPSSQPTPKCPAARINTRLHVMNPDIVGTSVLRNLSPLSDLSAPTGEQMWTLFIARESLQGEKAKALKDVQVDIFVSGITN